LWSGKPDKSEHGSDREPDHKPDHVREQARVAEPKIEQELENKTYQEPECEPVQDSNAACSGDLPYFVESYRCAVSSVVATAL
jgi:hypothetical protein